MSSVKLRNLQIGLSTIESDNMVIYQNLVAGVPDGTVRFAAGSVQPGGSISGSDFFIIRPGQIFDVFSLNASDSITSVSLVSRTLVTSDITSRSIANSAALTTGSVSSTSDVVSSAMVRGATVVSSDTISSRSLSTLTVLSTSDILSNARIRGNTIVSSDSITGVSLSVASATIPTLGSTTITATTVNAALSGNATTATTLQNSRTINGTSFNGSSNIETQYWGTSRNITVGNSTKAFNGGSDVSFSAEETGFLSQSSGTITVNRLISSTDVRLADGTTASPALAFSGSTNTGFSRSSNTIRVSIAGSNTATFTTSGITANTFTGNLSGIADYAYESGRWETARSFVIGNTARSVNGSLSSYTWTSTDIGIFNGTLTLATSGIATGSQTFSANQSSNATFTVNVPATNLSASSTNSSVTITSSTGTNTTIPVASSSSAGIVTATGTQAFGGTKSFVSINSSDLSVGVLTVTGRLQLGLSADKINPTQTSFFNSGGLITSGTGSIFIGTIGELGGIVQLPNSWSVSYLSTGKYQINHNFGNTDYVVIATPESQTQLNRSIVTEVYINNFVVKTLVASSGAAVNNSFSFILIRR